jgi:hypothetical protein
MIDDHPEGPPDWRELDELRATKRNWFYMDSVTIQFFKIPCGFQEDVIPVDPRSTLGDISFWDQIPLCKLPAQEFLPIQRIYNNHLLKHQQCWKDISIWLILCNRQPHIPSWGVVYIKRSKSSKWIIMDGVQPPKIKSQLATMMKMITRND